MLGKLDGHMQKSEVKLEYITLHKNRLQMDQRLKVNPEIVRRKLSEVYYTDVVKDFLTRAAFCSRIKAKN